MEAPESYVTGYYNAGPITELMQPMSQKAPPAGDATHFAIDDLLVDFPNDDDVVDDNIFLNEGLTPNDSSNSSSVSPGVVSYQCFAADSHFSGDLSLPYDELAELEWLSNFVEDSFSTEQSLQSNLHIISGFKAPHPSESSSSDSYPDSMIHNPTALMFQSEAPLPGKARSKRSRAAPGDWSTRLLQMSPTNPKAHSKRERNPNPSEDSGLDTTVRKCLHCATDKTPQWRTGPMGPKTLCNACGVRYKSGRLVPEYRPAASPTFIPTKHSNSHRKVLELRRQKEMHRVHRDQFLNQCSILGVSKGCENLTIHNHNGPNFRQMM